MRWIDPELLERMPYHALACAAAIVFLAIGGQTLTDRVQSIVLPLIVVALVGVLARIWKGCLW
jgi:hypothetical protein